ncbi:MAG: DUF3488 and transglutaminase-like domain-containing protein [Brachymonas sp.]|nr:DUF3488 and transglutaminase-like domain-containing protein [Brachymonas sp.]
MKSFSMGSLSSASRSWLPWQWSLARDSRDTLFLLAVVGWIVLMQAAHVPWFATAFCLAVLVWRSWLTWQQKPLPSRWLRTGLVVLAMALTATQFHTIVGREAGSVLILLLLTLKTLELKARRDAFVIFFLGFFTLLSHFLFSQSLLTAMGILLGVLALLTALVNAHTPAGYPPLRQSLFIALRMAALGAPIMVALFVLFPRFAPLWGLPSRDSAKTGLSNDMTVGTIAELAQDSSVAFRVRFEGTPPRRSELYFRGPVLSRLEGQKWTADDTPVQAFGFRNNPPPPVAANSAANAVHYEVLLQPHQMHWLLTLDIAPQPPTLPPGWRTIQMRTLEWVSHRPIVEVLRYRASSQLNYRHGENATPASLRAYLALPAGLNPRTRELAQQLLADPQLANSSAEQQVQAVLQRLHSGGYVYTLAPELSGTHAADAFWFDSKEGFCEHIANAFVVLMRNMQIPARIVTGYQGGELNPMDGMWTVRQSDAHAWAEVWLPQRGWVRVDPTAAVAIHRIEDFGRLQQRGAVQDAMLNISPEMANMLQRSLQGMRNVWDATNTRWNNWVLNYTQDRQFNLLRNLGFSDVSWTTLVQLLAGVLVGMALLGGTWAWFEKRQSDPWLRLLLQARQRLVKMGFALPADNALTPRQLLQQLHTQLPTEHTGGFPSDDSAWSAWQHWLLALEAWRYAPRLENANDATLRDLEMALQRLPKLYFG